MKKALVILMALSMVFAAFADEPAVKNEIAEFTGSASVTWGVDLDAGKTGFKNEESASLKFTLIGGGDKQTTGSGVWGDLKIKIGDSDATGSIATTGDVVIAKPELVHAKIHLNDMIAIGIRAGTNKYGAYSPVSAVKSSHFGLGAVGGTVTQGITVEVALPDLLDLNIDFRSDDSAQYTNNYGLGTSLAVKAVENLNLAVGFGIDFDPSVWGLSASADYKIGINDTMYLKPQVGFTMDDGAGTKYITTALLFGWGSEDQEVGTKFVEQKQADGFSVATKIDLDNTDAIPLCIGVWDSTFVENLKAGVQFHVKSLSNFEVNTLAIDFAYDLGGIKPAFGFAMDKDGDLSYSDELRIAFSVDFTGFVDNTTFTLAYNSGDLKGNNATIGKLGKIDLTAKISF